VPLRGPEATVGRSVCASAKRELARTGGKVGDVRVRATCLDSAAGPGERWSLAAVGANARRAVEDSTTVAYVGELDPEATKFSRPVLEAAGIGQVPVSEAAMAEVIAAIRAAGGDSDLRAAVSEALEAGEGNG
jgi:branched-chain amino acid transport system substrate-binding protein